MSTARRWLAQWLRSPTDSALGYGAGLAVLWAPIVLFVEMERGDLRRGSYTGLAVVITSIVGMLVGGAIIYRVTRETRGPPRPRERAVILAVGVPFTSVAIAAVQFVAFSPLGAIMMLFYGITLTHWGIVLTAIWSVIYLALPASGRIPIHARQPRADERARTTYYLGFFIISVALFAAYVNSFAFLH